MTLDTSKSDKNVEVRTPLTITKSKNTKFTVLYDPEKLYAATIIYEGEVEVTDVLSNKTMILEPTDEGKPRMAIVPVLIGLFTLLLIAFRAKSTICHRKTKVWKKAMKN